MEYETAEEFLAEIRKEFGRGDEETDKVAELKRLEQEGKIIEELFQWWKKGEEIFSKRVQERHEQDNMPKTHWVETAV